MESRIEVQGIYLKTMMRDLRDGFTTFFVAAHGKKIACSGTILPIENGTKIIVQGEEEIHPVFGLQVKNARVRKQPLDHNELLKVILSGKLGIGVAVARRIVDQFGDILIKGKLSDQVENSLVLLRGVNRKQAHALIVLLNKQQAEQELYDYLEKHGGVYKDFAGIYKRYGLEALELLKQQPYVTGRNSGLSFVICDSIAKENGGQSQSPQRLEFGVQRALQQAASQGHTYLERVQLLRETQRILRNAVFPDHISTPALSLGIELSTRSAVVKEENRYYLKGLREAEKHVAESIAALSLGQESYKEYRTDLAQTIMDTYHVHFSPEQREAFSLLESPGVKVLIGDPGTGKTTTVKGLVEAFRIMKPGAEILLCAPTGRAAQRMSEATGRDAYTIHRLLEFTKGKGSLNENLAAKALKADLYVIDESSMINIELADAFLKEIKPGATVIFVGDEKQLPSVEAGNFLHDLIRCGILPVVELTEVFRQKGDSFILRNARAISMGISRLSEGKDFHIHAMQDKDMMKSVEGEFERRYDRKAPNDIQVLACTRKTVSELNKILQKAVNPGNGGIRYGGQLFREGDKIIMINNNYKMKYFNGDTGRIVKIIADEYIKVEINQVEILLTLEEFEDMELGYAITVHKAQGSEYPVVLFVMPARPKGMLKRRILYTAITRGKKEVDVFAQKATLAMAVANDEDHDRQSTLIRRLTQMKKKTGHRRKGAA